MNITEIVEGQMVVDTVSKRPVTVLRIERPEAGKTAVMVRVHEYGKTTQPYWISATWLAEYTRTPA